MATVPSGSAPAVIRQFKIWKKKLNRRRKNIQCGGCEEKNNAFSTSDSEQWSLFFEELQSYDNEPLNLSWSIKKIVCFLFDYLCQIFLIWGKGERTFSGIQKKMSLTGPDFDITKKTELDLMFTIKMFFVVLWLPGGVCSTNWIYFPPTTMKKPRLNVAMNVAAYFCKKMIFSYFSRLFVRANVTKLSPSLCK